MEKTKPPAELAGVAQEASAAGGGVGAVGAIQGAPGKLLTGDQDDE